MTEAERVAAMPQGELLKKARELARCSDLSETPYTSAVLRRLCEEIEARPIEADKG
jgi:hypothetical protein